MEWTRKPRTISLSSPTPLRIATLKKHEDQPTRYSNDQHTGILCPNCRRITLSRLCTAKATNDVPYCTDRDFCLVGRYFWCAEIYGYDGLAKISPNERKFGTFTSLKPLFDQLDELSDPTSRVKYITSRLETLDNSQPEWALHIPQLSAAGTKLPGEPGQINVIYSSRYLLSLDPSYSRYLASLVTERCPLRAAADAGMFCLPLSYIHNMLTDPVEGTPAAQLMSSRVIRSLMAPETLLLLRGWLRECDQSHKCYLRDMGGQLHADLPVLPTRIVDLGLLHASTKPRLLITNGARAKYAALSHRWPAVPGLLTVTDKVQEFQVEIPDDALSKTFRDAFAMAMALGIRYIWVDCLCILQDDRAGWERESQKMGSFYEQAYLTIAATAVPGTMSDSFFSQHIPTTLELPCDATAPEKGTFFLTEPGCPDPQLYVETSQLNRRG